MKNLPEDELFNFMENKLRNYSELPDDEGWNKIADGVTQSSGFSKWTLWTNRTAATLALVILFFLLYKKDTFNGNAAGASTLNSSAEKKKTEMAESPGLSQTEITTGKPGATDIPATPGSAINALDQSKKRISNERASDNVPAQVIAHATQKDGSLLKEALMNNKPDNIIDETSKTDNVMILENETKEDSLLSVEHVVPPYKKRKQARINFYSMVSPSLSFHHVTPDSEDGVVVDKLNSPGVISGERFGFTIETGVQGNIYGRFQYIAGVSFYHQSQQISYEENSDVAVIESGDDLNYNIKPATTTQTFNYSMRNVGVQAGILYTLKQQGLMHKAGVVFQYQKGLMHANEGDVYVNSSSDYFNYQFIYRVEYTLRSGIGLFVQPAYTRSIIANESMDAPFKLKQSRASLGVGIVYRF